MEAYMSLLKSYSGRDKVLRTLGYVSVFVSGGVNGKLKKDLGAIAGELSHTRLVLRLFDDLPMFLATLKSMKGKDPDTFRKFLTVCGNVSMLAFFPFEKLAWLADLKILSTNSYKFSKASVACWALYLIFNLIKNIKSILEYRHRRNHLLRMKKLESPETPAATTSDIRTIKSQELQEYITLIKNAADVVMAVNYLPPGILWSEKLSPPRNAIFGIVSSVIGTAMLLKESQASKGGI